MYDVHQTCIGYIKTITNKFKVYRIENNKTLSFRSFYFIWYDICFLLLKHIEKLKKLNFSILIWNHINVIILYTWIVSILRINKQQILSGQPYEEANKKKKREIVFELFWRSYIQFYVNSGGGGVYYLASIDILPNKNCGDSVRRCKYYKNLIVFLFCFLSTAFIMLVKERQDFIGRKLESPCYEGWLTSFWVVNILMCYFNLHFDVIIY